MPIDLIAAVVAWLVAASGDSGIRLVRGSPDRRMLHNAVKVAVDAVVEQVDPTLRTRLRSALAECFSDPLVLRPDATTPIGDWLRSAITAQVTHLETWVTNDSRRSFLQDVPVDIGWLAKHVTEAIIGALRQVAAMDGLPELVHGVDNADVHAQLDALGLQLIGLTDAASIAALHRQSLSQGENTEVQLVMPGGAQAAAHAAIVPGASKGDWIESVMAFADIDDPEFRRTVLRLMADWLGLGNTFETSYRPMARDHVIEIVDRCWAFKDKDAARRALADSLISLRPNDRAAGHLARLVAATL
jgi:Effector-associated domain 2